MFFSIKKNILPPTTNSVIKYISDVLDLLIVNLMLREIIETVLNMQGNLGKYIRYYC